MSVYNNLISQQYSVTNPIIHGEDVFQFLKEILTNSRQPTESIAQSNSLSDYSFSTEPVDPRPGVPTTYYYYRLFYVTPIAQPSHVVPADAFPIQGGGYSKKREREDVDAIPQAKRIKKEESAALEIPAEQINFSPSFDTLCNEFLAIEQKRLPMRTIFDEFETLDKLRLQLEDTTVVDKVKWKQVEDTLTQCFWRSITFMDADVNVFLSKINPKLMRLVQLNWHPTTISKVFRKVINRYNEQMDLTISRFLVPFLEQIIRGAKEQLRDVFEMEELIIKHKSKFPIDSLIHILTVYMEFFPKNRFLESFKGEFCKYYLTEHQRHVLMRLYEKHQALDADFSRYLAVAESGTR